MTSNSDQINIQKIANGWSVTFLAMQRQYTMEDQLKLQAEFIKQVKTDKGEVHDIIQRNEQSDQETEKETDMFCMNPLQNVFLFKEFSEVLDFLADKIIT